MAASPPPPPISPVILAPVSSWSEPSFTASADRYFQMLAGSEGYITVQGIRSQTGSHQADPGVPLPVSYARFSCFDANRDGRVSALEYRNLARAAFERGAVNGTMNLAGLVDYEKALRTCAVSG
jgi:hypothetical protein